MTEDSASLVGRTIAGKFLIEELLGSGSMGQVYRGRHLHLEQTIALKVMAGELAAEPSFAARFEREARASFALAHPNVIRVIDYGRDTGGITYLAMEYIEGGDLAALIYRAAPLSTKRIALLMRQALAGLAAAHDAGVIHRDLKPENIMLAVATDDDGHPVDLVKVCDFGIAKLSDAHADVVHQDSAKQGKKRLTEVGIVIGTPEYMSPEQGRGDAIDARSDIYAMGVILYELLTGDLPFTASTAVATVMKQISEEPIAPSNVRAEVDRQLEEICLRALSKSPDDRYQTARQMRAALGAAIGMRESGESLPPPRPSRRPLAATETALSIGTAERKAPTIVTRIETVASASKWSRLTQSKAFMATAGASVVLLAASASSMILGGSKPPASTPRSNDATVVESASRLDSPRATEPALSPSGSNVSSVASAARAIAVAPIASSRTAIAAVAGPKGAPSAIANGANASNATSPSTKPPFALVTPPASATGVAGPTGSRVAASDSVPVVADPPPSSPPPSAAPITQTSPPPTAASSIDPSAARATMTAITDVQGARKSDVQNGLARSASRFAACYQSDLRTASIATSGPGVLHIETDESGTITSARCNAPLSPAGARCIERAVLGNKISNVDTGQAQADVAISFQLR